MNNRKILIVLATCIALSASPTKGQRIESVSPLFFQQIDSGLAAIGMHQRDLPMPSNLLDPDVHRSRMLNELFTKPFSSIALSESIADQALSSNRSDLAELHELLQSSVQLGSYQRVFVDNMPGADVVVAKLALPKARINNLNIASSVLLLRFAGMLVQSADAVRSPKDGLRDKEVRDLSRLDSLWRLSKESETLSVWEAYQEQVRSNTSAQQLYMGMRPESHSKMFALGPSLHSDLLRIARETMQARDILVDSIRTVTFDTPYGRIAIGGAGDDVYAGTYAMIIDVGGNDVYHLDEGTLAQRMKTSVQFIIDYDGDDTYQSSDYGLGAGVNGIGVLLDLAGNDSYHGGDYSLGSALWGVGILHDLSGDDTYTSGTNSQGSGIFGIGYLLDDAGNDIYRCYAQSQAFAGTRGAGILADKSGNDVYTAASPFQDVLRYDDHQITFAQGAALGSRPLASGGIAVLADGSGNDTYVCDIYGQGTGYWFAIGSLIDRGGNDKYLAYQYAQGSGVHFATGYQHDLEGNDTYVSHGVSQGCGHDIAYGMLFDDEGNDAYSCESLSLGAGNANAVSLFVDLHGNDSYTATDTSNTLGFSDFRRSYGMIGMFIDAQGSDLYTSRAQNNTSSVKSTYGLFLDGDVVPPTIVPSSQEAKPTQVDLPASIDSLFILASASHLRFQPSVEPARKKIGTMGAAALPFLERQFSTQMPRERLTIESALPSIYASDPDTTVAVLSRGLLSSNPASMGVCATILGKIKAKQAAAPLLQLATSDDWRRRRLAAFTAGEIGDTTLIKSMQNLISDMNPYVRARAVFAVGMVDSLPFQTLQGALVDSFQIVRYSAVEGIRRGHKRAMKEILSHLDGLQSIVHFRSNLRLLSGADTTKADLKVWKGWAKKLAPDRLLAARAAEPVLPAPFRSALAPSKPKKKKAAKGST